MKMKNLKFEKLKTKSGTSLFILNLPHTNAIASGVLIKAGTRDEIWPKEAGLAHALEHMSFQATKKFKNSQEVSSYLEEIGGYLNAFTSQEGIFFHNVVPKEYFERAIISLNELVNNSLIPQDKIKIEMRNIAEEIKMYFDNPVSYINMEALEFIYGKHPLGKNVLGTVKSVLSLKQEDFFNFKRRYFNSNNYIFVCVGNVKPENALKLFNEYFEKIPGQSNKRLLEEPLKTTKKTLIKTRKDITQTQVLLLTPTVKAKSFEAKVLDLYSTMLSGGMSFPLFQELRDKRGLCYHTSASLDEFSDSSLFSIYIGTDPKKYQEAIKVALEIINSNKDNQKLMDKAKDLTLGRLSLVFDDPKSILNLAVSDILIGEEPKTYNQIKEEIEKISINDIEKAVDKYLLNDNLRQVLLLPSNYK